MTGNSVAAVVLNVASLACCCVAIVRADQEADHEPIARSPSTEITSENGVDTDVAEKHS